MRQRSTTPSASTCAASDTRRGTSRVTCLPGESIYGNAITSVAPFRTQSANPAAIDGSDADFEKYRGKLGGKIILSQPVRDVRMLEGRVTWRMGEEMLTEAERLPIPAPAPPTRAAGPAGPSLADKTLHFEVKIVEVRDASAQEIEHGHVHGPGGHH